MISSTRGRAEDLVIWQDIVDKLHRSVAGENEPAKRLQTIADSFLGRPYKSDPLLEGPEHRERLVIDFESFDCVTLIELALSLARSRSRTGFLTELKNTRYRNGRVDWAFRHHYFNDWLRHNHKRGVVKIRTRGVGSRAIESKLGWIESLPERRVRFHAVPKKDIRLALPRIANGSIIAFASVRSRLDYFHTGLLFFRSPRLSSVDELTLYQARKSAGKVIKEPLTDFLKRERMRGVAFATPLGWGGKP